MAKPYKLPKDLEISKKQRHRLNAEAQAVRASKHESYLQNCGNNSTEMSHCQDSHCEHCER